MSSPGSLVVVPDDPNIEMLPPMIEIPLEAVENGNHCLIDLRLHHSDV